MNLDLLILKESVLVQSLSFSDIFSMFGRAGRTCKDGWNKFLNSCYFVSTVKKNWMLSREACIAEGADLAVIKSRGEQVRKKHFKY